MVDLLTVRWTLGNVESVIDVICEPGFDPGLSNSMQSMSWMRMVLMPKFGKHEFVSKPSDWMFRQAFAKDELQCSAQTHPD